MGAGNRVAIEDLTDTWADREELAWSRDMIDPALRAAVDTLPASMRHIAGYHFGWWDERGRPAGANDAGGIRSALVLLIAQALGGAPATAVPAGVAVELAHNFSLLHDDVLDGQVSHRSRPAAWSVFGLRAAILAGNALLATALEVLAASTHPCAEGGIRTLSSAVLDVVDAQSADIALETRADADVPEHLSAAGTKTGALLGCACALGAAFGGGSREQVEHMRSFGEHLGMAFNLVDDAPPGWRDPAASGGPADSDHYERTGSMPLVTALSSRTPAGRELAALYQSGRPLSGTDLSRAAHLVDCAEVQAWGRAQGDELLARALRHLDSAVLTTRATVELGALVRMAVDQSGRRR